MLKQKITWFTHICLDWCNLNQLNIIILTYSVPKNCFCTTLRRPVRSEWQASLANVSHFKNIKFQLEVSSISIFIQLVQIKSIRMNMHADQLNHLPLLMWACNVLIWHAAVLIYKVLNNIFMMLLFYKILFWPLIRGIRTS